MNSYLEAIIEAFLEEDLAERSLLVISADHGEELLEHGHVGHASPAKHATLYEEVLRIPLVIRDPRVTSQRRLDARLQGMDLFPSLLSLAGLTPPSCRGYDFSQAILDPDGPLPRSDRPFYFHSARMGFQTPREMEDQSIEAVSDGRHKFILEQFGSPRENFFDLSSDPCEAFPIPAPGSLGPDWLEAVKASL